jgi:predicted DNA-binding transcriptional regulator AlpA
MEIEINNELYISMDDVLEKVGFKEYRLYEEIRCGRIPRPYKSAPKSFWKVKDIEEYLERTRK